MEIQRKLAKEFETFLFAVQLCLLLPASRLDRIICGTNYPRSPECLLEWSGGQEEAEMTAECLLISRWRDGCSHPCLGWSVNHRCLLALSAAVKPNDGRKKGLKFHESAVEYFSWIRHNCRRRILLERRHLNASEETQWSDKQPHQTCLKITC